MSEVNPGARKKRRRSAPLLWGSGLVASAVLALGVNGTLSSWTTAIINNTNNNAGTAPSVILQETGLGSSGTSTTCTSTDDNTTPVVDNTSDCSTINKYGNAGADTLNLSPTNPGPITTSVTFTNTGTGDASAFTLAAGACSSKYNTGSQSGTTVASPNLCDQLQVAVTCTPSTSGDGSLSIPAETLTAFAAHGAYAFTGAMHSGESTTCAFSVSLPTGAPASVAGQTASQILTWTLTA